MYWDVIMKSVKHKWYERFTLIVGTGSFAVPLFANTLFNDKYKNVVCMYRYGAPQEIHPQIHLLFTRVLKDLKIDERKLKFYEPFLFVGLDTYLIGASYFTTGAKIGIPLTYAYSDVSQINATNIYISKDLVDWTRPDAKKFLETLVMSEAARKFAIAREVVAADSLDFLRELCSYPMVFLANNMAYWSLYNRFNLARLATPLRFTIYGALAIVSSTFWLLQDNYFAYWKEKKIDKKLSALGPEYVKGGFEFYDKILQRNMTGRILMDEESKEAFTERGEQNSYRYVFKKSLISNKRNFFAQKSREVVEENPLTTPSFS